MFGNSQNRIWPVVQLGIIAAMFITAAVRWSSVPDRLPIHWSTSGEVDGYGGKFVGLLLLPLITLGIYVVFAAIPRLDPARANYASFRGVYTALKTVLIAYMGFVYLVMNLAINNEDGIPVDSLMVGSMAVLLFGIGLVLGKVRPNYFVGIRTPWTLTSKRSWVKTHRVGGWVFIAAGIATGIGAIFSGTVALIAMAVVLVPGIIYLTVYSYRVWKSDPDKVAAHETRPGPNGAAS